MSRHVLVREQEICQTTFFVESIDETTRAAYRDIDCVACLRQAIAAAEQRTAVIRDLLAKAEEALVAKAEGALTVKGGGCAVTRHAFTGSAFMQAVRVAQGLRGPEEQTCEKSHYAALVEAQKDVEIYQLGDVECPSCLRRMLDKHAAIAEIFRARLASSTEAPLAMCHECAEVVEVVDGKLATHHGETGLGCALNDAVAQIYLHPLVVDRIARLETELTFGPRGGSR